MEDKLRVKNVEISNLEKDIDAEKELTHKCREEQLYYLLRKKELL